VGRGRSQILLNSADRVPTIYATIPRRAAAEATSEIARPSRRAPLRQVWPTARSTLQRAGQYHLALAAPRGMARYEGEDEAMPATMEGATEQSGNGAAIIVSAKIQSSIAAWPRDIWRVLIRQQIA